MKSVLASLVLICVAYGNIPMFESPVFVQANGEKIVFKYFPEPCVADWNGDGKKDLIVGYCYGSSGNVKVFLNSGTNQSPVFTTAFRLEAGGEKISVAGSG